MFENDFRGIMIMVVGKGHDDPRSNPGWGCLFFTKSYNTLKCMNPTILLPVWGK